MSSRLHSKRLLKRIVYSKPFVIFLVIVTAFSLKAAWGAYQKMSESGERVAIAQAEKQELQEEREVISENLERLQTRRGIEEELRKKYSLTKEGEEMVVIVDSQPEQVAEETEEKSVFGQIWGAVVNFFD
ncbi:MAG: septum formation initiator family protein [Candidatus Paceibacterota bacterium]